MRDRFPILVLAAGVLLAGVGCATHLRPAPEATIVPTGRGEGAELTPILVKIENESRTPLRVRYEEFALVDAEGRRWAALPPFDMEGAVNEPVRSAYGSYGYHVAPHLYRVYPHMSYYHGPFAYDPIYYYDYYPRMFDVQLPTTDMLAHALPEGVLDPGGRVSGFLYFERVEDPAQGRVDFRFDLVDAAAEKEIGRIEIPFVAD